MVSRLNYKFKPVFSAIFLGGFRMVFCGVLLFLILIFAGLISYGAGDGFWTLFTNAEFQFAVLFTLKTTVGATLIASISALPTGFILARSRIPGKFFIDTLLDLPLVLPPLVSGVALLIVFGPMLGEALNRVGIRIVFTTWGVIAAQWFITLPFAVKMFKEAFAAIDSRYEKVARTLGYTPAMVFLRVTLPMAKRGIWAGIAMTWARTLGEFGATAMLAGVTRMKTETLPVAIYLNMSIGELRFALAISILLFLAAVIIITFLKFLSRAEVAHE